MKNSGVKILAALLLCAVSVQAQVISGAFGVNLGSPFDPAKAVAVEDLTDVEKMYQFAPASPYPGLTDYFVLITPTSHQVYAIIARGAYKDSDQSKKELPALMEAIKRKYPVFSIRPGKQPDSHGFYPGDIEKDWDISLTGSSYKLAAEGDRFIFSRTFQNGRSSSPEVALMVGYVDNRLKALSKEEFKKLKAAELENRIKKADSSGL